MCTSKRPWFAVDGWLQVDSYEFAEPKDIIPELKKEFWEGLASAKWSERKVGVLALPPSVLVAGLPLSPCLDGAATAQVRAVGSVHRP
jgi:hypothetical protein